MGKNLVNEIMESLQITPAYIVKWIVIMIIVVVIIVPLWAKVKKVVEQYRGKQNLADKRNKLIEANANDVIEIKDCMVGLKEVLVEIMHDRISNKCKEYLKLKFIPDDEYDDFTRQWKLYRKILKGNHGLEKRYEKAIVLPLESEYRLHNSEN
jgi:hypothetical protein